MCKWKCTVCGFVFDGDEAPAACPKCGAPKEKFERLSDEKAQLVERSRLTNGLHMQLHALLGKVASVSEQGIRDNLDPACVKIFNKSLEESELIRQMVKAEIEGHMGKGKWG